MASRAPAPARTSPSAFGLSGLFSTSPLHLFILLLCGFYASGGPPAGRPRFLS
jgi:hypothetical protein